MRERDVTEPSGGGNAARRADSVVDRACHRTIQRAVLLLWLALLALASGCQTPSRFPPVDLHEPGWKVQSGQAVWRRQRGGEGIAGELRVATRPDGRAFIQFTKNPFTLAVAQGTPTAWTIAFPPQNRHFSGQGPPPRRIIFFQLPQVLAGHSPPRDWSWQALPEGGHRLQDRRSGESLDVYFNP